MTSIGFYHLTTTPLEKALPKLLEKVVENGLRAVVLSASTERRETLNQALWTYHPASFLPHGSQRDGHPEDQPIWLTTTEENPNDASVLVLTENVVPAFLSSFTRCLNIFDGNDLAAVENARMLWKTWQEEGHSLTYWRQTNKGTWEKE